MEPLGVVLTAGMGTRLRPLTPSTPKPLVPLLNRPLIAYALDLMGDLGLHEVAVVTGPDDDKTREYATGHARRACRSRSPCSTSRAAPATPSPRSATRSPAAASSCSPSTRC